MSTETIRNVRDPVQDGQLNFHTAPDLCSLTLLYVQRDHKDYQGWPPRLCHSSWALNKESSSSVLFYVNRDQKDCLGRPPGLSHSSWALKVTSEQVSATNIPHPSAWAESKLWILLFQSRMVLCSWDSRVCWALSLRSFPSVAFETVPVLSIWLKIVLS